MSSAAHSLARITRQPVCRLYFPLSPQLSPSGVFVQVRNLANTVQRENKHTDATRSRPPAPTTRKPDADEEHHEPSSTTKPGSTKKMTVAERDAALMNSWKERQGSLANAELEDGQLEGGYRRNVKANIFRYI
ncbi:hypothetical protein C8Q80DRAFT_631929 [Daedaleopsis nitida]|nr:hypothetical protein C8Q80DRAFT_631929 [Daedaleopsis nitida]